MTDPLKPILLKISYMCNYERSSGGIRKRGLSGLTGPYASEFGMALPRRDRARVASPE